MNILIGYLEMLIGIIYLILSPFIIRNIAKNNEWDTSYKKAFIVVILWAVTSVSLGLISNLIIMGLASLVVLNASLYIGYIIMQFLIFVIIVIVGALLIRKIYEGEFNESVSMLISFLIGQSIITTIFMFFLPIFNL